MPNGFMGPEHEWRRMEAPYVRIDPILEAFAQRHGLAVQKNYRDADRSLRLNDSLERAIWVNSSDKYGETGTYDVSVLAHQDRPERFIKGQHVAKGVPIPELDAVLTRAVEIVRAWLESDLELPLPRPPRDPLDRTARGVRNLAVFGIMLPIVAVGVTVGKLKSALESLRGLFRRR
jgi:hypothetical protein